MEEELRRIRNWASHGTIRQFYTEVSARVAELGYEAEVEGNTLTCYKVHKEGGFLGIGARKIKEVAIKVTREGDEVLVPEESADEEFVRMLAAALTQH